MKKLFAIIFMFFVFVSIYNAQNTEWLTYDSMSYIRCLAIENDFIWIGSTEGLLKFNKITGEKTFYNIFNSGLPVDYVSAIAIDNEGNKWIGTDRGLVKFDGSNWIIYNQSNSELPSNSVQSIAIDNEGNKWLADYGGGVVKFDGVNWTVYNTSNSGLPFNVS